MVSLKFDMLRLFLSSQPPAEHWLIHHEAKGQRVFLGSNGVAMINLLKYKIPIKLFEGF